MLTNLYQQDETTSHTTSELEILTLGISVNNRLVLQSALVRGYEDGFDAVDLENWQIPYEIFLQALGIQTSELADGQLELRAPNFILRINPKELTLDRDLGQVLKIKDIEELFDVLVEFDMKSYRLLIQAPWLSQTATRVTRKEPDDTILLDGLPKVKSPLFSFSHLLQEIRFNISHNNKIQSSASFQAIGTAFQGKWRLGVQQGNILENPKLQISSFEWVNSEPHRDYIVGKQQTFLPRTFSEQYWGVSLIQRHGYTLSPTQSTNVEQRNQATEVKRTIEGKAEPGTFVILRPQHDNKNIPGEILGKILVDETGIYRFANVSTGVFVVEKYPKGRLTANPQIKVINLGFTQGQLSSGTSSSVFSAGWLYQPPSPQSSQIIGNFSNFQAGFKKKWGVSESLTLGIGGFYHRHLHAIGELFFHPHNIPLSVYFRADTQDNIKGNANIYTCINYRLSNKTQLTLNGDLYSQTLDLNHQLNLGQNTTMRLLANIQNQGNFSKNRHILATGTLQLNLRQNDYNLNVQILLDRNQELSFNNTFNLRKAYRNFIFAFRTNLSGIDAEVNYNLPRANFYIVNNQIALRYQGYQKNYDILINPLPRFQRNFLELSWQYANKNGLQWRLGAGMSNNGFGINATLSIPIFSGLNLSARYQSISQFSHTSSFQIQINSSFNLQQGLRSIGTDN